MRREEICREGGVPEPSGAGGGGDRQERRLASGEIRRGVGQSEGSEIRRAFDDRRGDEAGGAHPGDVAEALPAPAGEDVGDGEAGRFDEQRHEFAGQGRLDVDLRPDQRGVCGQRDGRAEPERAGEVGDLRDGVGRCGGGALLEDRHVAAKPGDVVAGQQWRPAGAVLEGGQAAVDRLHGKKDVFWGAGAGQVGGVLARQARRVGGVALRHRAGRPVQPVGQQGGLAVGVDVRGARQFWQRLSGLDRAQAVGVVLPQPGGGGEPGGQAVPGVDKGGCDMVCQGRDGGADRGAVKHGLGYANFGVVDERPASLPARRRGSRAGQIPFAPKPWPSR